MPSTARSNSPRAVAIDHAWLTLLRPQLFAPSGPTLPAAKQPPPAAAANAHNPAGHSAASIHPVVHSVFEHSANILFGDDLLTVLARPARRAPGAMLTSLRSLDDVRAGAPVECRNDVLHLDSLRISTTHAEWYDCLVAPLTVPSSSIQMTQAGANDNRVDRLLNAHAQPGSFLLREGATPFEFALTEQLRKARTNLGRELRRATRQLIPQPQAQPLSLPRPRHETQTQASRLGDNGSGLAVPSSANHDNSRLDSAVGMMVGLGVGLTPSGDDYLIGALAALSVAPGTLPAELRERLAKSVLQYAMPAEDLAATTRVSRHFLLAACRAEFQIDLATTARLLFDGEAAEGSLSDAFARTASNGSTSGTDALFGLIDTIRMLTNEVR